MALSTITVLDGNSVPILVQVLQLGSVNTWAHVVVDGLTGSNVAQVTSGNALKVDGSGVTQPVSFPGGVTVTGSVSIVQGANTAAVSAVGALKVDGSAVAQPISGVITANIGTPGLLALETGGNLAAIAGMFIAPGTALGANKELMIAGSVTAAAPTYAAGQISPLSLTLTGGLRVDGSSATQPVSGSVSITQGGNTAVVKPASTAPLATDPALVVSLSPNSSGGAAGSVSIAQGGNTAAVKAASTAPVATDPALVVSISPNSQNPNGQATMLNSSPVVIASNQTAVPVTLPVGQTTMAGSTPVAIASNQSAVPVAEGRLGQAAMSASFPVTMANNQSSIPTIAGGSQYKTVAASATNTALQNTTGAIGDYLEGILCVVATAATSQVMIGDGAAPAIVILPNAVGGGVGSYYIPLGIKSITGSWRVTTAAGVSIIATGTFT